MIPGTHLCPPDQSTQAHLCLTEARDCWIKVAAHKVHVPPRSLLKPIDAVIARGARAWRSSPAGR